MRFIPLAAVFAALSCLASAGEWSTPPEKEFLVPPVDDGKPVEAWEKSHQGENDGDSKTPVRNPRLAEFNKPCYAEYEIQGNTEVTEKDREQGEAGAPKVVFFPGARETLEAIFQKRLNDWSRDPQYFEAFGNLRDAEWAKWRRVHLAEDAPKLRGLFVARHNSPPPFKLYEIPLDGKGKTRLIHFHATSDPHTLAVLLYGKSGGPGKVIVRPYCWRSDKEAEEPGGD